MIGLYVIQTRTRLVVATVVWTLASFVLIPRLPIWARVAITGAVYLDLAYMWGVMSERKRRMADQKQHAKEMTALLKASRLVMDAAWQVATPRQPLPPSTEIN